MKPKRVILGVLTGPVRVVEPAAAVAATTTPPVGGTVQGAGHKLFVLPEEELLGILARQGDAHGITVHVYVLLTADKRTITGTVCYTLSGNRWQAVPHAPAPDVLLDRCFSRTKAQRQHKQHVMKQLLASATKLLNAPLPGKFATSQLLAKDALLAPYVPPTALFTHNQQLADGLRRFPEGVVLKPDAGMQGRGIIRIRPTGQKADGFYIDGRTAANRLFSTEVGNGHPLLVELHRRIGRQPYILQPWLPLQDANGQPFDVRVLVQKNSRSQWSVTGSVVRRGQPGSVTANLHGGGQAEQAAAALSSAYGSATGRKRLRQLQACALRAAAHIEAQTGRQAELGIDFGLTPDAGIWLLEMNSKPGRAAFAAAGDEAAAANATLRLLQYAWCLARGRATSLTNRIHRMPKDHLQEVHS